MLDFEHGLKTNLLTDNCVRIAHRRMLMVNVVFNVILVLFYTGATWRHLFTDLVFWLNSFTMFWNLLHHLHREIALLFVGRLFLLIIPLTSFCVSKLFCLFLRSLWKWMDFSALDFFFFKECINCMGYCKKSL